MMDNLAERVDECLSIACVQLGLRKLSVTWSSRVSAVQGLNGRDNRDFQTCLLHVYCGCPLLRGVRYCLACVGTKYWAIASEFWLARIHSWQQQCGMSWKCGMHSLLHYHQDNWSTLLFGNCAHLPVDKTAQILLTWLVCSSVHWAVCDRSILLLFYSSRPVCWIRWIRTDQSFWWQNICCGASEAKTWHVSQNCGRKYTQQYHTSASCFQGCDDWRWCHRHGSLPTCCKLFTLKAFN